MGDRNRSKFMTDLEVLEALHTNYTVDIEIGEIYSNRTGQPLYRFSSGSNKDYDFVRIHYKGFQAARSVSKMIWMYSRNAPVPPNCEIHHISVDSRENNHRNLICIYKDDHRLIHILLNNETNLLEIPF